MKFLFVGLCFYIVLLGDYGFAQKHKVRNFFTEIIDFWVCYNIRYYNTYVGYNKK